MPSRRATGAFNVVVAIDDVHHQTQASGSEAGPAPERIVVAYGFWIFLLSDIVTFSALFAAYAVLVRATAGGPTFAGLFNQTSCLLASSYTCGLMSLAVNERRRAGIRPAPSDEENITALKHESDELMQAAGHTGGPGADAARRLAEAMLQLANADRALRMRAELAFVSRGLKTSLDALRNLLLADIITKENIPPAFADSDPERVAGSRAGQPRICGHVRGQCARVPQGPRRGGLCRGPECDGRVSLQAACRGTHRLAGHTVVRVVKASARRVGLDPELFAGHSLRSGFLTSAAGRGASIFKMMDVSRHKSMDTLRGYVRDAELFRDHAGAGLL